MLEKIVIFVFTSMVEGQDQIDAWLKNHAFISITHFELTSNKFNICLAISYIERESMKDSVRRELDFNGGSIYAS